MSQKTAIVICGNMWTQLVTDVTIGFLKSIKEKTSYPYEIILYENNSKPELLKQLFTFLNTADMPVKIISPIHKVWFNMNSFYNQALAFTDADYFVFANNDMTVINHGWLSNLVKWLDSGQVGMICPQTSITYGNFFNCENCPLMGKKDNFVCLFEDECLKKHQPQNVLWEREWPSLGIYACTRSSLKKAKMHDPSVDLLAQDLSTMLRFENAGLKCGVAMDSLVDHHVKEGHLTLDYIATDGSDDYNFRSVHAYKQIYDYIKDADMLKRKHPGLWSEFSRWYGDFYTNSAAPFSHEEYQRWCEKHEHDHKPDVEYGKVCIAILATLQNEIFYELTINCIESVLRKTKYPHYELMIYENNSRPDLRTKLFDYLMRMKLNTSRKITWVSIPQPIAFNMNRVWNQIVRFSDAEVFAFLNHDIEIINENWLTNAVNWILFSDYREIIGYLLTPAHESVPARHEKINTIPERRLDKVGDTPTPIVFLKRDRINGMGGFDESFAFKYNDADIFQTMRQLGLDPYVARDVLAIHYEGRPLNPKVSDRVLYNIGGLEVDGQEACNLLKKKWGDRVF